MSNTSIKKEKPAFVILKRELKAYFASPMAYIVSAVFLCAIGIMSFITFFINNRAELRQFFSWLPIFLSFFVPALTMRVFSDEKRTGSMETLMTLPVTEKDVVVGKYLASFLETLIMLAPTLLYVITICVFGSPDFGPIIGGYIGAIFLCASYTAIGLFASSVTENQIIAFIIGLLICIFLTMLDSFLIFFPGPVVSFFSYLSARNHFNSITKGIVDTRDIIYFVSLTALFFVLTVRTQKKERM